VHDLTPLRVQPIPSGYKRVLESRGYRLEVRPFAGRPLLLVPPFVAALHDRVDPPLDADALDRLLQWFDGFDQQARWALQDLLASTALLSTTTLNRADVRTVLGCGLAVVPEPVLT
jgi:hypothetical protein